MDIRNSYQKMIKSCTGGWPTMCSMLGMTKAKLEARVYERKGQSMLVETALLMQTLSETTCFAEAVANESGGVFIPVASFEGIADIELLDGYTAMVEDEGRFATDFRRALKDGEICRKEFEQLRDDIRLQQAHEMELIARIESMIVEEK
jgi:hypothetical protein